MREDVGRAGHHRQGLSPAAIRVGGPEHGADRQRRPVVGGRRVESEDGLGDHQPDVVLHPVFEAARPPLYRVGLGWAGIDPHASVGHGDRECPHVVGERVERAAAREVEPSVMPVAGEDAFADGAPVEREPHVGTPVVDGGEAVAEGEDRDGVSASGDDSAAPGPHLFDSAGAEQTFGGRGHWTPPDGLRLAGFSCQDSIGHRGVPVRMMPACPMSRQRKG